MTKAVETFAKSLSDAIDARKAYEANKSIENESIQSKLNKLAKDCAHIKIAEVMCAAQIDANFINRQERVNARFNIYSAQKVVNAARASVAAESLNHYSRAILATMKAFAANEMQLTHKDAESACSLSVKVKDAKREKLIVKYQKHCDAKTASTQSSSSLNALQALNVIREARDAANNVVYTLNSESALAEKLLAAL